jgi:tetratricopeptide (TPR) repeat protein
VVSEIASSGRPQEAIPIIDKAVQENPGDTKLLDLQFRLKFFAKDFKGAVSAGEELAKLDTAMMDTTYFQRMAAAFLSDSQPQKASEQMARATQKFPTHAASWMYYAQMLRQAGQTQQAAGAVQRAIANDPNVEGGLATLVQIQMDANQPDSAYATISSAAFTPAARQCVTTVADSTKAEWQQSCKKSWANTMLLSNIAAAQGNKIYRAAAASKKAEDFRPAVRWLILADSVAPNDNAKLLLNAAYVQRAQPLLQQAQAGKSCEPAREANEGLVKAQVDIPKLGRANPQLAGQLLQFTQQLLPYSEQMMKAYCK